MRSDDHYFFEEEFHQEDRKRLKKERKIAQSTDRSKFKKTNQNKTYKKELHYHANTHSIRARVLSISKEGVKVSTDEREFLCTIKGSLKNKTTQEKNLLSVGDFVQIQPINGSQGQILSIDERYSFLAREDISGRKKQLIAANIDQVLITTSVVLPPLKSFLIDRYIIAARKGNMDSIILINKIDLLEGNTKERLFYQEFLEAYSNYPILSISTITKEGVDALKKVMKKKTSVFSGQSGVGKSSLINALLGLDLPVGGITHKTQKGTHTTTTAILLPIPGGGFCIDTPGIKGFGIWNLTQEEVIDHFTEIKEVGRQCKYPNCLHKGEPYCAVQKAVQTLQLSRLRFESYLSLIEDIRSSIL